MTGKVLFTKKNEKGIYGFINSDDGSSHYFDTSCIIKGNYIKPGSEVEFDVIPSRDGKTQAINVRILTSNIDYDVLPQEKVEELMEVLNQVFLEHNFIDCAKLPDLFKKVSVNYKNYAEDLKAFVDKYLYTVYSIKRPYQHNDKIYPMALVINKSGEVSAEIAEVIIQKFSEIISENGFLTAEKIPGILKDLGIDNYRDYAGTMDLFVEKYCGGIFVSKKRIRIEGKLYPKIYVLGENADLYQEEDNVASIVATSEVLDQGHVLATKVALKQNFDDKDFIAGGMIPSILRSAGIDDYKKYARNLESFIETYLSDEFEMKKNEVRNGKCEPSIIVLKNTNAVEGSLNTLYQNGDSRAFLSSSLLANATPLTLGVEGVQMALYMLADYLGENRDVVTINDFHRILISTSTVPDLKQYKENTQLLELGAQTAYLPLSTEEFAKVFANVHNGKRNLNNNWNGILERFWTAKSALAIYLTCLVMVLTQKDTGIDNYLGEAYNDKKIDKLPMVLRVYTDFLKHGNNEISLRLKKKIIGHCFDCHDMTTLCQASKFFDNYTLSEVSELIEYLNGDFTVDDCVLMSWFHGDIGEMIAEKITNYYWWRESRYGLSNELIKTFSSVLWEYPENYFSAIIYNNSCPDFGKEQKEKIIAENFINICAFAKEYKKAFVFVNYIYNNYIESLGDSDFDSTWHELKLWMKEQLKSQLTNELSSAHLIRMFRYDDETSRELEQYYCDTYVSVVLKKITSEEELDSYINKCEEINLPFVAQWVINNSENSAIQDNERYIRSLIDTRRFDEAIAQIQAERAFSESQKLKLIKDTLCANFEWHALSESAYNIFDNSIPEKFAEQILLHGITFVDALTIKSLICIYAHRGDWVRALYLYIPFKAIHEDGYKQFISDFYSAATAARVIERTNPVDSHYDVVKCALRVYDAGAFDEFIHWTKRIVLPATSKKYSPKPKSFDNNIKIMLSNGDYDDAWKQMLFSALKTDNNEKQDALRYCIVTSFIGRYGVDEFERAIITLSRNKHSTKGFSEYYISLWKGLLTGRYSANFLRVTRCLVKDAPVTFWNVFYDIAVCKNHVFSTSDFHLKQWIDTDHEIQEFYNEVLTRYSISRETVFLKIAASILAESSENIVPSFDQYLPYCNSNRNKDFLFVAIIKLLSEGRYINEIEKILKVDYWRGSEEEYQLISALHALCSSEYSLFFSEDMNVSDDEKATFKTDFLECAKTYPKVEIPKYVREHNREFAFAYQYKFVEWILRIRSDRSKSDAHSRTLTGLVPVIHDDYVNDSDFKCYVEFNSTVYKTHLKTGSNDIVYVRNRYYRLLVDAIMLETNLADFNDDDIIMIMQRNKHFSSIFPEYKEFRTLILEFAGHKGISGKLKTAFLVGVVSNNWEQFVELGNEYDAISLELIRRIEDCTNYRYFNRHILKSFVREGAPDDLSKFNYVKICSPEVYSVLQEIGQIYACGSDRYEECRGFLSGIAHLDDLDKRNVYVNLQNYLKHNSNELNEHWDMYIAVLLSTNYVKTIINYLAGEVRKRNISVASLMVWRPVFAAMKELSAYYYIVALKYAMERNPDKAKETLASIPSENELPMEWSEEKLRLEGYISGKMRFFYPGEGIAIATLSVEKEAKNVSFIDRISPQRSSESGTNNGGINAYKSLVRSDKEMEDVARYNLYLQLFTYVRSAEDLYDVYRQVDGQTYNSPQGRLTFNELVIEYGSLAVIYHDQLSADQRLDILLEIFEVYQLLNDVNKMKSTITYRLSSAEQRVLETPGVSFEKWLSCKDQIHKVLKHEVVAYSDVETNKWLKPVAECAQIVESNDTEMLLLSALENWRNAYNLLSECPDYENAFIRSVDEKILALKKGINLLLTVNNTDIEDDRVFYQVKNISPYNNVSIRLDNSSQRSAHLQVIIRINNGEYETFEGGFSAELDLRSNDTCGQAYKLPQKILDNLEDGDELDVIINLICNGRVICNNKQRHFRYLKYEPILTSNLVSNAVHYGTAVPAFSATIKGFGRESEKENLRDLLEQNLAIIYGPSRAGKSSLLNYLANDYLKEYADFSGCSSFLRIRIADEQNSKNDYVQNMLTGEPLSEFENSTQIMEYLFLSPLKIAFNSNSDIKQMRMCKNIGEPFPDAVFHEVNAVLAQNGSVVEKYGVISQILSDYHCQVWLMYDEFQQVVEKWVGNADELAELCTAIKYNQTSIKLVLCGSDELVRIFECSHDSNWDEFKVKTAGTLLFVGQLSDMDFAEMMNDRTIWRSIPNNYPWDMPEDSTNLPAVLRSLYEYTGGNAICGKLFGEEILKKLKNGDFSRRRFLYPADITHIAYDVLNSEASQIKNLLITHTTKNLQNERPYLLYIAHELASDINLSEVSFRKICEFFATKESNEIETALKLLVARGILKTTQGARKYSFATLYYFDCYKNQATDFVIDKLKSMMSDPANKESEEDFQPNIMDIMQLYDALTPHEKYRILSMVYADDDLPEKSMEEFKKRIANNYRDVIQNQTNNNILFNAPIQLINTAFSSLIGGGSANERLEAFSTLPKLEAFYTDQERDRMKELQAARPIVTEDDAAYELSDSDVVVIDEIEEINSKAQNRYYGEMVSTMLKQSDATPNSSVFAEPTDEELKAVLGIKKSSHLTLIKELPQEYYRQLCFAVALHKMILPEANETIDYSNIDFSPISIMYCKLVEIMLKDNHLKLYGEALSELTVTKGESFAELNDPEILKKKWKDITIGTFVWHLIVQNVKITSNGVRNKSYFTSFSKNGESPKTDKMPNIKRLSDYTGTGVDDWKDHAMALAEVVEIRNSSAHGGNAVSKAVFDHLLKVLFTEGGGEIVRIWELYQQ